MSEHTGPAHARDCLAGTIDDAHCGCARGAWLDEMVPRSQARAELLAQLSGWAREQRIFDDGVLNAKARPLEPGPMAAVLRAGVVAARSISDSVWGRVTAGATNLRRECDRRPARPCSPPAFPATAADQSDAPLVINAVTVGDAL